MLSMSDQSGASDSDLDRYEHQHHSDSDGDGSRKDSTEDRESDSDEGSDDEEDIPIKDVSSVHLCHDHKGCDTIVGLPTGKEQAKTVLMSLIVVIKVNF